MSQKMQQQYCLGVYLTQKLKIWSLGSLRRVIVMFVIFCCTVYCIVVNNFDCSVLLTQQIKLTD